jgi:hypothetical protein
MVTVPVTTPFKVGANCTFKEQLAPAASVEPHALVIGKKLGELTIEEKFTLAVPVFVNVIACGWLVPPTLCTPKSNAGADKLSSPAPMPTPCKGIT